MTADPIDEAAAKAIFDTALGPQNWDNEFYREERNAISASARTIRLAILRAMRERGPTEAMLEVDAYPRVHSTRTTLWRAMLDAEIKSLESAHG